MDAEVVRVRDRGLLDDVDGGYRSDLFEHLVEQEGYRGGPRAGLFAGGDGRKITGETDRGPATLLQTAGQKLSEDKLRISCLPLNSEEIFVRSNRRRRRRGYDYCSWTTIVSMLVLKIDSMAANESSLVR